MIIYADIVLMVNFIMNLTVLWGAGQLCGRKVRPWGLVGGAALMAGVHVGLMVLVVNTLVINLAASLGMIVLGVFCAFRPRGFGEWVRLVGMCYVVAFALGGMGMALFYFAGQSGSPIAQQGLVASFSLNMLLASVAAFYIAVRLFRYVYAGALVRRQVFYDVYVHIDGCGTSFRALLDTGNSLRDPLSNSPVIIAELAAIAGLPEPLCEMMGGGIAEVQEEYGPRLRLIPFRALGTENGILKGFRCDRVEICRNNERIVLNNAIIGVIQSKLGQAYQGLLNPEILAG